MDKENNRRNVEINHSGDREKTKPAFGKTGDLGGIFVA
jgi:hypothetical protein